MTRTNEPVHPMSVRLLSLSGMVLLLLLVAAPAWAKIPPFTVSVDPENPVAGDTTTITAEFESSFPVDELSGVLGLYKTSVGEPGTDVIPLTLERVDDVRFEARVIIGEAGTWTLAPFPDANGRPQAELPPGYPGLIDLQVTGPGEVGNLAPTLESNEARIGSNALIAALTALAGFATIGYVATRRSSIDQARERSA